MKDLIRIYEPEGARLDLAVEQLASGLGFVFDEVWFRKDGTILRCEAVSPYVEAELPEASAAELISHAQSRFELLKSLSESFRMVTGGLETQYSVIVDYGMGTVTLYEMVGGRLARKT